MLELMETILSFPMQGHYGYPIRIDVFDSFRNWEFGTWSDRDYAIGFVFDKCELFGYELEKWYTIKNELYIVITRRSSDV